MNQTLLGKDTEKTLQNREKLSLNKNLLFWYSKLYEDQFEAVQDASSLKILEIGSGTSPLKRFIPIVMTSDVMRLDYLDYIMDAHEIDKVTSLKDNSLDIITMTNVLHHLQDPLLFLTRASLKLKPGGKIIFTEPFFSIVSKCIYVNLHHEPTDFHVQMPKLDKIEGPLSSANIALPYLIFFEKKWDGPLQQQYEYRINEFRYFSSISYYLSGGISRSFKLPHLLYKIVFHLDLMLSKHFPRFFASFFTCTMTKK